MYSVCVWQELCWEVERGGGRLRQRGSAWALALCCLRALLRDAHPRRAFNHYQMSRVALLDHLLLACKVPTPRHVSRNATRAGCLNTNVVGVQERFLNSSCGALGGAASSGLVEVVRGLLGAPPLLHRLALLCDFLLLMHQVRYHATMRRAGDSSPLPV